MITIACCQYQIENLTSWESYVTKVEKIILASKKTGASILLMPEYAGVEIVCRKYDTDYELFSALQSLIPKYIKLFQELATLHQIYIQAGTILAEASPGKFVNRAYFFSPDGTFDFQDKLKLTQYEIKSKLLEPGKDQKIFNTSFGKIAIAICYDSEFPELIRNLIYQGANIILVPSYTTSLAGYNRIFLSCRARAIENQCYVAMSFVVNEVDLCGEPEFTHGQAAIVGPADVGFPDDGLIAQGKMNQSMLITTNLSLEALEKVRKEGQVLNFNDSLTLIQHDR